MQLPNFLVSLDLYHCLLSSQWFIHPYISIEHSNENKPKKPTQMIFFFKEKKAMHFLSQLKFLLLQFSSSFNWLRLYIIFIE